MNRKTALAVAAVGIMLVIAAIGQQKPAAGKLLVMEWASKAKEPAPLAAILIEMGLKDNQPRSWAGKATVAGAKVVHREGYRFWPADKLVDPDSWEASSHRPIRLPKGIPAAIEGVATVGIVLHLSDIKGDAALTVEPGPGPQGAGLGRVTIPLKNVLLGKTEILWNGAAAVRLISTATPVVTGRTEDDFPAACYGPDGTLWVAYVSYHVKEDSRRIEPPMLDEQPKDFKSYYTPEFRDQLFVKYRKDGKWSEPMAITDDKQDLMRCAIAAEKDGTVWVVYSANRMTPPTLRDPKGHFRYDLYARPIRASTATGNSRPSLGDEKPLTSVYAANLSPVACTDQSGAIRLSYQSFHGDSFSKIGIQSCKAGKWDHQGAYLGRPKCWHPTISAGPNGETAHACDSYADGDYDLFTHISTDVHGRDLIASSRFEARPSICYDPAGRLWIAYEEGPEGWGKDFGALDQGSGMPLYNARSVRVVCLVDNQLMKPVAELPTADGTPPAFPYEVLKLEGGAIMSGPRYEKQPRYAYPQIGIDGRGRVWIVYRVKWGTRYSTHAGCWWTSYARRLDGDRWSEPIEIHHSDGLLDHRPVLLPHPAGGLRIIHNTDSRFTTPENIDNQIYMSYVDLPGDPGASATGAGNAGANVPVSPKLVPHDPGKKNPKLVEAAMKEAEDIKRCRDYRIEAGGKKYQLLRGEFHRHTEISFDGGPDGSLEDMWRYAIDVAGLDWIGNGDHDSGAGREYSWWLIQKTTDAYHVKGRFVPMFSYERHVPYPHGHRNCVFAKRGVRTLPRLAEKDETKRVAGVHADDARMFYRYLKELDGICASHTSATSMGTDWRDNDPAVEPLVEIYQGDRMSYEKEGAPRAGYDPKSGQFPPNVAGWYPLGFVDKALGKGYRLGFQASSDHWSTHISYCIVLAERPDREGILDAMKKRHVYGATDNIIVDVRSGNHIMGDEFKTKDPPSIEIRVIGTAPLARVEVLKDSDVVQTFTPMKADFTGRWTDPNPRAGVHYYYVRVQQSDGELAWGSPMWIELGR
jgi:hypothetical protein